MKECAARPYDEYAAQLPDAARQALEEFFAEFDAHCLMIKSEKRRLRTDFENALLYYAAGGTPLRDSFMRLDIKNLGGFYARPPLLWFPLDDAAKIYPISMQPGQMSVFRLSIYFKAPCRRSHCRWR